MNTRVDFLVEKAKCRRDDDTLRSFDNLLKVENGQEKGTARFRWVNWHPLDAVLKAKDGQQNERRLDASLDKVCIVIVFGEHQFDDNYPKEINEENQINLLKEDSQI